MSTVLVVDDEAGARRALMRVLEGQGYETIGACDGKEAMQTLESRTQECRTPDLVLLDVLMPELDGLEMLELLHADPRWKALPVVMLTAVSDINCIRRAEQLGAKAYLVKATVSVAEMLGHVREYTGQVAAT